MRVIVTFCNRGWENHGESIFCETINRFFIPYSPIVLEGSAWGTTHAINFEGEYILEINEKI